MIKLIDILKEVSDGLIGPFYHETSQENVESILKHGLRPSGGSNSPDIISVAPAAPSGLYGDTVIEVYLTKRQFNRAVKDTYNLISADLQYLSDRDLVLMQKLINDTISEDEYRELTDRAVNREDFAAGELTVRELIPASQVKVTSITEGIDDPVKPGILKKRLGKLSCSRVRSAKSKLKDKGTHYAKALQRYLNYHC
jgi:hypothetical protein